MEKLRRDIEDIKESQIRMEEDVRHHIKRTDILEELHKDNVRRIDALEAPRKAKQYLTNSLFDMGKIAGAILTVLAILKYLNKL